MRKLYTYIESVLKDGQKNRMVRQFLFVFKQFKAGMTLRITHLKSQFALHKVMPLRQRYVFSKSGRVRMRYRCAIGVFALSLIGAPIASYVSSYLTVGPFSSVSGSEAMVLASADVEPLQDISETGVVEEGMQKTISEAMRAASEKLLKKPRSLNQTLTIEQGQTIAGALQSAGLGGDETVRVMTALKTHYDPRNVKVGQVIDVRFKNVLSQDEAHQGDEWNVELAEMNMKLSPFKALEVKRNGEKLVSKIKEAALKEKTNARSVKVNGSVYGSAKRSGVPSGVVAQLIKAYSGSINFKRDIHAGDEIDVLYESKETEDGEFAKLGNVLYASVMVGGKQKAIYRHKKSNGRVGYYYKNGKSVRKGLMRHPISGVRISSGYGMRRHPISGRKKMHTGIDYAARSGTPIRAASDGVISYAARRGGYGKYISIRHNSRLSTAYAHMSRYAKGMRNGKRVKQGQIIGYVGSTGHSTGPHLHYEVLVNGKHVNPRSSNLPMDDSLGGKELQRFKANIRRYDQEYASRVKSVEVAASNKLSSKRIH